MDSLSRVFSTLLAGLFTIVMVFATIILPVKLHLLLSMVIPRDISSFPLLWYIGVVALCLLVVLVVAGFILEKTRLAALGSFLLYLPSLSYLALMMWWLYGIGILRVLWLPIADFFGYELFSAVGELANVPGLVTILLAGLLSQLPGIDSMIVGYSIHCILLGVGSFIFLLGTEAWLYGRRTGKTVINFGVYRYSRHPQYLGFILWSYGGPTGFPFPSSYVVMGYVNPGFPWFLSMLLVVCVALFEEQTIVQEYGETYQTYREETPFLLPLPSSLAKLVTSPMRLLLGKAYPTKKREIAYVFFLYLGLYLPAAFLFHHLMLTLLGIL